MAQVTGVFSSFGDSASVQYTSLQSNRGWAWFFSDLCPFGLLRAQPDLFSRAGRSVSTGTAAFIISVPAEFEFLLGKNGENVFCSGCIAAVHLSHPLLVKQLPGKQGLCSCFLCACMQTLLPRKSCVGCDFPLVSF